MCIYRHRTGCPGTRNATRRVHKTSFTFVHCSSGARGEGRMGGAGLTDILFSDVISTLTSPRMTLCCSEVGWAIAR